MARMTESKAAKLTRAAIESLDPAIRSELAPNVVLPAAGILSRHGVTVETWATGRVYAQVAFGNPQASSEAAEALCSALAKLFYTEGVFEARIFA